jgi:hypothetical protein
VGQQTATYTTDLERGAAGVGIGLGLFLWVFVWLAIAGPALVIYLVAGRKKPSSE